MVPESLGQVSEWSHKALKNGLRRHYEKVVTCVPKAMCETKEVGKSSAEVMFAIYQAGSKPTQICLNKGRFQKSYNMFVESGLLLAAVEKFLYSAIIAPY